jgi:hypothetical protein
MAQHITLQKNVESCKRLGAHVQDDDGTNYPEEAEWDFDPSSQ